MNQTKQSNTNLFAKNKQKPLKPKRNTINLFCCCCCFFFLQILLFLLLKQLFPQSDACDSTWQQPH